ncbi:DUF4299 family protein [Oceanivirga miroungae]|uniref:Uncharacterized protein n=1 Tax=Oceanivirga miroungae TaxID=1130046 RepID=A0A6I8MDE4_9FUSO|nr:DUF4299 family protein [Oceanivirga miroungae]VWL85120.1 hypothetical protein OMES3154_00402 [Oceanivirga miroungae]
MEIIIEKDVKIEDILSDGMIVKDNMVIIENVSSMPVTVEKKANKILVRLNKFSTENDFEIAKKIVANIDKYSVVNIDYEKDLKKELENIQDKDTVIQYINRPVYLSKELIKELLKNPNLLSEFSKLVYQVQYIDIYEANVRQFYDDNKEIIYMYYVNRDTDTLIKYVPVESNYKNSYINIVDKIDNKYETINIFKYSEFLNLLKKEDFSFIDSNHVVIKSKFNLKG